MDERTLHPWELVGSPTIRPKHVCSDVANSNPSEHPDHIGDWKIIKLLCVREHCRVFLAERAATELGVVKLFSSQEQVSPCIQKLVPLSKSNRHLLSIIDCGTHESQAFEVTPYMSEGTLHGIKLDDNVVMHVVIPQLVDALQFLHQNGLLHNDIKPSNLYWDSDKETIVLGDFDTVTFIDQCRSSEVIGTKEYMAPEILAGGQQAASRASDFCSMGITLIALMQGESPLYGKTDVQLRRTWMRGVPLPETIPPQLKILINGLIQFDAKQRLDYDGLNRWMNTYKVKCVETTQFSPSDISVDVPDIKPLWFDDYPVIDIYEMVEQAGQQWEYACFLLAQKRISVFLRQFDIEYYKLCCQCEKYFDKNEGLFALLHSLARSEDFYWCGEHYENLEDFSTRTLDAGTEEAIQKGAHFIRSNMLEVYLSNKGATEEKLELAKRLAHIAYQHPELAITELLATMSTIPELKWKGHIFRTLEELANWLLSNDNDLDEVIHDLYHSKKFEAWLNFINQGSFLYEIQSTMKGVTL